MLKVAEVLSQSEGVGKGGSGYLEGEDAVVIDGVADTAVHHGRGLGGEAAHHLSSHEAHSKGHDCVSENCLRRALFTDANWVRRRLRGSRE